MIRKHHCNRDVGRIPAAADYNTANSTPVMTRIKTVPPSTEINFKPSTKVHRVGQRRYTDVAEITGYISGWNVKTATQSNRQMGKIATDTDSLPEGF